MSFAWWLCCFPRASTISIQRYEGQRSSVEDQPLKTATNGEKQDSKEEEGAKEGAGVDSGDPSTHAMKELAGDVEDGSNNGLMLAPVAQGAVMGDALGSDELPKAVAQSSTHFHDLLDDCLVTIFSLIGHAQLPIHRPKYRDLRISHPLQCALVCSRWRARARPAVQSLSLSHLPLRLHHTQLSFLSQASHFANLRHLRLPLLNPSSSFSLSQIARNTPGLRTLHLLFDGRFFPSDLPAALRLWPCVRDLSLEIDLRNRYHRKYKDQARRLLAGILPEIVNSVEVLTLYSPLFVSKKEPIPSLGEFKSLSLRLNWLPTHVLRLRNLADLHLDRYRGQELPAELGSVSSLETLTLSRLYLASTLPTSLGNLQSLRVLEIRDSTHVLTLPIGVERLQALRSLTIESCGGLMFLPDALGQLLDLEILRIRDCALLADLPENLGSLRALRVLHLSGCPKLERLPASHEELTGVEDLNLEGPMVGGIPRLGKMEKLRVVRLAGCLSLPQLPERLTGLERLVLRDVGGLKALPNAVGNWGCLRDLRLEGLGDLEALPEDGFGRLRSLEAVELVGCGLVSLPATLGLLSALTRLCVRRCGNVENLPGSVGALPKLTVLHVEGCGSVRDLHPVLAQPSADLKELVIRHCGSFCDAEGVIARMSGLRFLGLAGCDAQRSLPAGLEKLPALCVIECSPEMIERARVFGRFSEAVLDGTESDDESVKDVKDGGGGDAVVGKRRHMQASPGNECSCGVYGGGERYWFFERVE